MRLLSQGFIQGLRALLPAAITFSLVYWLGALLESLLGRWLKLLLPDSLPWIYWKGAGVGLSLLCIFLLGLLFYLPPVCALFRRVERLSETIPVVRTIYGASRDLTNYFFEAGGRRKKRFSKVVLVTLPETRIKLIGLVTQEDTGRLPRGMGGKDELLVYLPMSYQLGGYTVLLPKSSVTPLEMSTEEALRFTMTAGVSGNHREPDPLETPPCG